jgi:hypothetical protein
MSFEQPERTPKRSEQPKTILDHIANAGLDAVKAKAAELGVEYDLAMITLDSSELEQGTIAFSQSGEQSPDTATIAVICFQHFQAVMRSMGKEVAMAELGRG